MRLLRQTASTTSQAHISDLVDAGESTNIGVVEL